jgi:hypothetical protein
MKTLNLIAPGTVLFATVLLGTILLIHPAKNPPPTSHKHPDSQPPTNTATPSAATLPLSSRHRITATNPFARQARQIASMPQDTEREDALQHLAREWARTSPTAAERWAAGLEDPAERERALTHLCLEVASQDPREAIRIARSHRLHPATIDSVASRWASTDFPTAFSWTGELPEGELRDRLLMCLIQTRAADAPAEAAVLLSASPLSDQAQEEAAMTIVHQWILKDPEAARQWVELFPEGPTKERAAAAVQGMTAYRGARTGG